jgi:diguanylate cyclase (GGDEF)-like protein/PAS domain S-box-containing protein
VTSRVPPGVDKTFELYASIVEDANELITVFNREGTIVFVNAACRVLLGYEPEQLLGRCVVEFVHPDEYERAVGTLQIAATFGTSTGTTLFRLRAADGSHLALEMTSAAIAGSPLLMTIARPADTRAALDAALRELLEDRPVREVIVNVCRLFTSRGVGTEITIAWMNADGSWDWLGTAGASAALSGVEMRENSVWAEAIRTGQDAIASDREAMAPELRPLAAAAKRGGYWIGPVTDIERPVVISVWTAFGGFPPLLHAEGMTLAKQFMRLIVRWADQQRRLDRAARLDELTDLPNRRSFFDAIAVSAHGAILYCDLDRFKPVNDQYGHPAGDEVLRQVARRLRETVRTGDTVARIGGDEFAIICPGSTAEDAKALAERLRAAVASPIDIGPALVQVGISVGIAHTMDRLDAASVAAADRDLYAAKAARRAGHPAG